MRREKGHHEENKSPFQLGLLKCKYLNEMKGKERKANESYETMQ